MGLTTIVVKSFKNSNLNHLRFENVYFNHSLDFSSSSLINRSFKNCCFLRHIKYSFDRADLK